MDIFRKNKSISKVKRQFALKTWCFICFALPMLLILVICGSFFSYHLRSSLMDLELKRVADNLPLRAADFETIHASRKMTTELLADFPPLISAVENHDKDLIQQVILPIIVKLDLQDIEVYDVNFERIWGNNLVGGSFEKAKRSYMEAVQYGLTVSEALITEKGLTVIAAAPIHGTRGPVGVLVVSGHVSDKELQQLKGSSDQDISIFYEGKIVASSISAQKRAALAEKLRSLKYDAGNGEKTYNFSDEGYLMSIGPLFEKAALVITAPADNINLALGGVLFSFLITSAIGMVLVFLASYFFSSRITGPVKNILCTTAAISKGNFKKRVTSTAAEELTALGNSINLMAEKLEKMIEEERQQARLKRELEVASEIQMSLQIKEAPQTEELNTGFWNSPAYEVGGDFFDILADNGLVGGIVADVMGKGVPAALISTIFRNHFRVRKDKIGSPSKVLFEIDKEMTPELSKNFSFITAVMCSYSKDTGKMVFSNAGHYPPLLYRRMDQEVEFVDIRNSAIGFPKKEALKDVEIPVQTGDIVVMFTDGLKEATNNSGEQFGITRLKETIMANADEDAQIIATRVGLTVQNFMEGSPQRDDFTIVVFKVR